jgi:hypothetical protein
MRRAKSSVQVWAENPPNERKRGCELRELSKDRDRAIETEVTE